MLSFQLLKQVASDARCNGLVTLISPFNRDPYDTARISAERPLNGFRPLRDFVTIDHPTHEHIIDNKLMDMVRNGMPREVPCAQTVYLHFCAVFCSSVHGALVLSFGSSAAL